MVFFPHWYQAGIKQISDLFDSCQGHFLPFNSVCNKFNVKCSFLQYYCPFRGCAGDWVKLGVAKRHGAVLGDAICLNSSLLCVLVDVVRCKMGKFSCCVPGCTNNWRNSPEKSFTLCRVMLKSGVCMKNSYGTRI